MECSGVAQQHMLPLHLAVQVEAVIGSVDGLS